jgi:hypothetical protein
MTVTPKVAHHLRASMVGQLGAGLASFGFHLQPPRKKLASPSAYLESGLRKSQNIEFTM